MWSWNTGSWWSAIGRYDHGGALSGRDARIDTLRGLFLVVMTLDHLPAHPLIRLSYQSVGFVSAAEGFVFLSGFISAWVYGKTLVARGEAALRRRAWWRARDLYVAHVLIYSFALVAGQYGSRPIAREGGLWGAWWRGALLIHQPPLFGILPIYVMFMLLLPFVLTQFAKGRAAWIWTGSIALWLAAQWGVGSPHHDPKAVQLGFFNIFAWQLVFVGGAYFGFAKVTKRAVLARSRMLFGVGAAIAVLLFLVRHRIAPVGQWPGVNMATALGAWRATVHPLRVINFAAVAYLVWFAPRSIDRHFDQLAAVRFLRSLGENSLQVFCWSILACYAIAGFGLMPASASIAWRLFLPTAAALSLVIPAYLHQRWVHGGKLALTSQTPGTMLSSAREAIGDESFSTGVSHMPVCRTDVSANS